MKYSKSIKDEKELCACSFGTNCEKKKTSTSEEQRAKAGYHAHPLHAPPLKGRENHLSHPPGPTPGHAPTLTP